MIRALEETRLKIVKNLQERRDKMSKKDEEQHEWDLWQINGLLDHRIAFKVLD